MIKNPLIMHLLVALVWLFLSGNPSTGNFLIAFVVTYLLMALFRKAIGCESYIKRVRSLIRFLVYFVGEVVSSNLRIMRVALQKDAPHIHGEYIEYEIAGLTEFEVLLISYCIGLSPGTMVAGKSEDDRHLIIHTFASGSPDEVRALIDRTLKYSILAFTR
jgi:multicomponent Na+:H+ antiporter subunit E